MLRSKRRDIRFLYLHRDAGHCEWIVGAYRSAYLAPGSLNHWTSNDFTWRQLLNVFAVRHSGDPNDTGFSLAS